MSDEERRRRPERLADLLPAAARRYGLEEELATARAMAAWQAIVAERLPAATGSCRLTSLRRGIAVVTADEPIVAQEIRLRAPELIGAMRDALRGSSAGPIVELRVTVRHV